MKKVTQFELETRLWNSLTPREQEAASRILEFPVLSYSDHAEAMDISPHTFSQHMKSIRLKLSIESKIQLYALMLPYWQWLQEQESSED